MPMFPRFRGLHELTRNGRGRSSAWPASFVRPSARPSCIRVEPAEGPGRTNGIPRSTKSIFVRCIFCGFCQEACPYGAIILRENYETAELYPERPDLYNRDQLFHAYQK